MKKTPASSQIDLFLRDEALRFGRSGRRLTGIVALDDLVLDPRILFHHFIERDLETDLLRLRRRGVHAGETVEMADLDRRTAAGGDDVTRRKQG
jgi:hypothetical protein